MLVVSHNEFYSYVGHISLAAFALPLVLRPHGEDTMDLQHENASARRQGLALAGLRTMRQVHGLQVR